MERGIGGIVLLFPVAFTLRMTCRTTMTHPMALEVAASLLQLAGGASAQGTTHGDEQDKMQQMDRDGEDNLNPQDDGCLFSRNVEWTAYEVPKYFAIDKSRRCGILSKGLSIGQPYRDPFHMWSDSDDLKDEILRRHRIDSSSNHVVQIWVWTFTAAFDDGSSFGNEEAKDKVKRHALRLCATPPTIFGNYFFMTRDQAFFFFGKLQDETLSNLDDELDDDEKAYLKERHDMAQWIAAFHVLGKFFNLAGWEDNATSSVQRISLPHSIGQLSGTKRTILCVDGLSFESCAAPPKSSSIFANIRNESGRATQVSHGAMEAMVASVDATSGPPNPFHRLLFVGKGIATVLGVDLADYFMPQTKEDIDKFRWDNFHEEQPSSFPKGPSPTDEEFKTVRLMHVAVGEHKKRLADNAGVPTTTIYSYTRYKELWKQFRDVMAAYRHMHPEEEKSAILSIATSRLGRFRTRSAMMASLAKELAAYKQKGDASGGRHPDRLLEPRAKKPKRHQRNDISLLDSAPTPRMVLHDNGNDWAPPTREKNNKKVVYSPPGFLWKKACTKKMELLLRLRDLLFDTGIVGAPMTFSNVVDSVLKDTTDVYFLHDRHFLYLVSLIIREKTKR